MGQISKRWIWLVGLLYGCQLPLAMAAYDRHPQAEKFIERMVTEHQFDRRELLSLLSSAEKQQSILDAIARPAEKTKAWFEYRKIFLGEKRIAQGVEFWQNNRATLARAEKQFGVPAEIIVAIIGVETRYGRHKGSYRVLDALTTLGFDYPRRSQFFSKELAQFLLLAREQQQDPQRLMGSYAGAMGYGQFIPSSYRAYAIDYDRDGFADIWNNTVDAIGSVANYFKAHGWRTGELIVLPAKADNQHDTKLVNKIKKPKNRLTDLKKAGFIPVAENLSDDMLAVPLKLQQEDNWEFWLGFTNFYVITRYNRSHMYAMAVWQLSEEVKRGFLQKFP